jgi:Fur family ferric uptake transcriptional regulator
LTVESKVFRNFLGEKGLKLTKERSAVLKEVFSFHGHFEPEQLYFRLRDAGVKASRASVYRTLHLLVESGLVEKIARSGKGGNIYEHTYGHHHHDHMICELCGHIIEFYSESLESLQERICRNNNFKGISHTVEIRGHCESCTELKP